MGKIIDNIQININSIYIRYEDTITSTEKYAFGFILKSLSAHTTNKTGKIEFTSDKDSTYKLVSLDEIGFFLDYNSATTTTDIIENFPLVARMELEIPHPHRYILKPVSLKINVHINKNNSNLSIPQISLSLVCSGVSSSLEARQFTHILKLLDFLRVFQNWQKGITIERDEFDFTYAEDLQYRVIYKK